jgi:hypothetical protein
METGTLTILSVAEGRCKLYCDCGGTAEVDVKRLIKEGRVVVRCDKRGHEWVLDFEEISRGLIKVRVERLE